MSELLGALALHAVVNIVEIAVGVALGELLWDRVQAWRRPKPPVVEGLHGEPCSIHSEPEGE